MISKKTTHHRKWSIRGPTKLCWGNRHAVTISPIIHASDKFYKTGSENIQEALYCRHINFGTSLPFLLMGPPLTPSYHDTQHVTKTRTQPCTLIIQTGRQSTYFLLHIDKYLVVIWQLLGTLFSCYNNNCISKLWSPDLTYSIYTWFYWHFS